MNCNFIHRGILPIRQFNRQWHNWHPQRGTPKIFQKDIVPLKMLKIDEPVSGSIEYGDMGALRRFEWDADSLNSRGFLRFQKEYEPPDNARETVITLARSIIPQLNQADENSILKYELVDSKLKFQLLSEAFMKFDHSIPNSMLYMMKTIKDVGYFYATPIKTKTPFENLVQQKDDLPPNLHVQKEPLRFQPDKDTVFGVTAFPKSSTIVTGLRSKKKYQGYQAKTSWP